MRTVILLTGVLAAGVLVAPAFAQAPPVVDVSTKGDFVYLDFNPPGGKAPAVKFACNKGTGRIDIAQYEAQPKDQTLHLDGGGVTADVGGKKATGSHGDYVRTQVFASDKYMTNFRSSGNFEISGSGFDDKINAGALKPTVEKFFAACEEGKG